MPPKLGLSWDHLSQDWPGSWSFAAFVKSPIDNTDKFLYSCYTLKTLITMQYQADPTRYDQFSYNRCGRSGLLLPPLSLGLWHNFGGVDVFSNSRAIVLHAFDRGITHFDLANNYGPPYGSAEENFGRILKKDLHGYRDEL